MNDSPTVLVCGSVNVDSFVQVSDFPTAGETVIASPAGEPALGGKGANQAVAASRFGDCRVALSATVGTDAAGDLALGDLVDAGVDVSGVTVDADTSTGSAFIINDARGENIIIVTSGANILTDPSRVTTPDSAEILLAQGELTPAHSSSLPDLAERLGARLVLNLAPVTTRDRRLLATADPLILNETEAADVLGVLREIGLDEVLDGLVAAVGRGLARSAVVTLGAQGALVIDPGAGDSDTVGPTMVPSPPAPQVVDTTGAGDAFCGTLAAALARGETLYDAARYAVAAGSLAVRAAGAAPSYAKGDAVRALAAGVRPVDAGR
ncbi:ribokinase [Corynebacterium terpenotabidum]|uniref:Ribokinase n=1 Tax=Corynebacterium terpenotabidum Y-11 TaxID=1200352 RepID=S4XHE9_9CORY|nr:ribokinase [Corynebacterium terpenotabidum]AGP32004.1 ribokinase [Corynebacterium terpenotabidum Y-11]